MTNPSIDYRNVARGRNTSCREPISYRERIQESSTACVSSDIERIEVAARNVDLADLDLGHVCDLVKWATKCSLGVNTTDALCGDDKLANRNVLQCALNATLMWNQPGLHANYT